MNIPAEFFRRYAGNLNSLNTDMQIHSADYYTNAVKVLYTPVPGESASPLLGRITRVMVLTGHSVNLHYIDDNGDYRTERFAYHQFA